MKLFNRYSWAAAVIGSAVLAFGLYQVHSVSGITEGGCLGLTLLLHHWFRLSPAVSSFLLNVLCYALGWKMLGRRFLIYSAISAAGFSVTYKICEQFAPLWPDLAGMPLISAIIGALFVGIGAGLCVRVGGAPSGDDALAMSLSKAMHVNLSLVYLCSDAIVLFLSLSYIPAEKIVYSLLTVLLSGQIIGLLQKLPLPEKASF